MGPCLLGVSFSRTGALVACGEWAESRGGRPAGRAASFLGRPWWQQPAGRCPVPEGPVPRVPSPGVCCGNASVRLGVPSRVLPDPITLSQGSLEINPRPRPDRRPCFSVPRGGLPTPTHFYLFFRDHFDWSYEAEELRACASTIIIQTHILNVF